MSDIPTEAFHEILRRLPTAALHRLQHVCKAWRRTINDYLRLQIGNNHLIFRNYTGKLHTIPLTSLYFSNTESIEATSLRTVFRKNIPIVPSLPVCSCRGLVLLWTYKVEKNWAIWNPFTKECFELPSFHYLMMHPRGRMARGGIGYDRVVNDYKVVRVSQIEDGTGRQCRGLKTLIYSLKSDKWRRIADYANCIIPEDIDFGVFANGAIHWIMHVVPEEGYAMERIIALDLSSHTYRQFPTPLGDVYCLSNRLYSLNECLMMSYSYAEKFDVWMMKGYGEDSTWTKFVSLEKVYNVGIYLVSPRLVAYIESIKHVLIQNNEGKLMWFDVENKCGKILEIEFEDGDSFSTQVFPVSHLRFPGSSGAVECAVSEATLKRKRKSAKNRMTLKLKTTNVRLSPDQAGWFD